MNQPAGGTSRAPREDMQPDLPAPALRLYTVEQADRTLPLVRRIVEDAVAQYQRWQDRVRELDVLNIARTPDAPHPRADEVEVEALLLAAEIEGYRRELAALGVELTDYETGRVAFPALIQGRPALLLWRPGEPGVRFWHERGASDATRRPIPSPNP